MKAIFFSACWLMLIISALAQPITELDIELEELQYSNIPALHSYAFAVHDGKWLVLSGRTNGLHGFQPPSAFPVQNFNSNVYVIDPETGQVWSQAIAALPVNVRDHISTTNNLFVQRDSMLYILGGYGVASASNSYITFPNLTAVHVPDVIAAVMANQPMQSFFRQITNQNFAITGGYLELLDETFYAVGGHRFDGRYNPHGGASFTQTYTDEIRKFQIDDNGQSIVITNYTAIRDTLNLHRRDYNLVPQIFPNGELGMTAFTGVFQYERDVPWMNSVDITANGYIVRNDFEQQLNQYHTAHMAVYDSAANAMHSIFLGG